MRVLYSAIASVEFNLIILWLGALWTGVEIGKGADICSTRVDAHVLDNGCDSTKTGKNMFRLIEAWDLSVGETLLNCSSNFLLRTLR